MTPSESLLIPPSTITAEAAIKPAPKASIPPHLGRQPTLAAEPLFDLVERQPPIKKPDHTGDKEVPVHGWQPLTMIEYTIIGIEGGIRIPRPCRGHQPVAERPTARLHQAGTSSNRWR